MTIYLNFGVYTADKPTEVVKQFRPLLNAIEASMTEGMGKAIRKAVQNNSKFFE